MRRLPIGAELVAGGLDLRVWAPTHETVTLVLDDREVALERAGEYHHAHVPGVSAGARYRFRLGTEPDLVADPASRFQPEGPFGPSQVIDPSFSWTDSAWVGPGTKHVIYELHVGTFTPQGTYAAAAESLPFLAELGVTMIELMPLHGCAGRYNWGYDGVNLFAPPAAYGTPDELRRFVDRAHAVGIAVILDVVYNHFGPDGNQMFRWSPLYRSAVPGDWGDALAFEQPGAREFFITNAAYWISEFHLDGLRVDATQAIEDESPTHLLAEIITAARAAAGAKTIFIVGENEPQDVQLFELGFDALWNDDFHHTARVTLTGVSEGYLHDYRGSPQELLSAVKRGFLYQGQMYAWQQNPRGTPTRGLTRDRFVHFLENHDQVANIGFGERLTDLAHPGAVRAMTALLLLTPSHPMLFQGQESGSRAPWNYFVDHGEWLHDAVRKGRAEFMTQFLRAQTAEAQAALPDPCDEATFRRCILDPGARTFANPIARLHRDLLALRRQHAAFTDPRESALDGAVLGSTALVLRYFQNDSADDRLLLVNFGARLSQTVMPEPLLAPPAGSGWELAWSSEAPIYGGHGTPPPLHRERMAVPGFGAVLLVPDRTTRLRNDPNAVSGDEDPMRIIP